ncbi:cytochrome P450 [Streptomyces sp. NBC_01795]|uniref:cytochrome P450 n=1 Tax=Streptomyces sp. NBC_01795 TaxID=2975943 RepID=UPI002DD92627|nr:cytochrome P450 [Streptomyces sp. NBC_01795]WSA90839.1 cytochrome P450 [Streptomyces sp. NBC_01795]
MTGATQTPRDPLYDPLAPAVIAAPHPYYRRLRQHKRVYWHAQLDSWVLTGYAECRQVLGDTTAFGSDFRRVGEDIPEAQLSVQSLDPPEHGAIRHLLVSALHARSPASMAEATARLAERQVAGLRDSGRPVDLVSEFARPLALRTMCGFLGVEPPDGPWFEEMSNAIVRSMDAGLDPARAEPGTKARGELSRMVGDWLETAGGDGFLGAARAARDSTAPAADRGSTPCAAGEDTPGVPETVLANSLRAVLHAGYESVSRLLGNALARLVAEPALLAPVGGGAPSKGGAPPEALDALVDELLRLEGPVQADARVCVSDTDVGEERVRRGEVVVLMLGAANRDPEVFAAPDTVGLNRRRGVHLAFGRGAHACLGAAFATLQLRAVLSALGDAGLVLTARGPAVYEPTATLRGLRSLPVSVSAPAARPHAHRTA